MPLLPEKTESTAMIITLTGNNSFLLSSKLKQLTDKFVAENGELALERMDGEETDAQAISDSISSMPFLSKRKMLVVKNLGANKQAVDQIEQIISSVGDTTDLIIYEPTPDKRTVYFKVLKTKTDLQQYSELEGPSLAKWLAEEAQNLGGELSISDANYLVERLGAGQMRLVSELQKLIIYEPKISRATIDLLTEKTPQSRVFDLLDAAFSNNKKRALELYGDQKAQRVEPQAIIAMIAWQLWLMALTQTGKGYSAAQIAKDAGLNPYPVIKAQKLTAKIDDKKLKEMVERALYIDEASKTRALNLDEAIKTFIISL